MNAWVLLVLSQVVAPQPPVAVGAERVTYSDGQRTRAVFISPVQVADYHPSEATKRAVLAADAQATVLVETRSMRVWAVRDAKALLARVQALRPVLFGTETLQGPYRVPVGLVCGDAAVSAGWREVLQRGGVDGCLVDFWSPVRPL